MRRLVFASGRGEDIPPPYFFFDMLSTSPCAVACKPVHCFRMPHRLSSKTVKQAAGYSGTPLIKKLGIQHGQRVCVLNAPADYPKTLGPLPVGVKLLSRLGKPHSLDFIQIFSLRSRQLEVKFPELKTALTYDGILWISWPKKASKVETDLDENVIRQFGLDLGLVDVKVAAVDEIWSGLKFVYRLENRKPQK